MLEVKNITKIYKTNGYIQKALDNVSVNFRENEFAAILGPSGSGKTTLLNIIGGLDRYDDGDLIINGVSTKKYKDKDWDAYRNKRIGFIFQSYNLISHQSILSNVELALTLSGVSKKERKQRAIDALEKVGLKDHIHKKPNQLSGGQMQRVAIARALVNNPEIILADEPTGALDSKTSIQVMELLKEVAKDRLVIMVTHNPELASVYATRVVNVKDGHILSDSNPYNIKNESKIEKLKHTKLSFFTALGLSLNNLLTKKGRTALTSFAGSIGIIGIAAILALSSGVNNYIKSQEEEMLGSYPIELEKQAIDLESMMNRSSNRNSSSKKHGNAKIYSQNIVKDTVETTENMIKSNDLNKFNTYLNNNKNKIKNSISSIEYGYNVIPQVYRENKDDLVKVSPSTLLSNGNTQMQSSSISSLNMSGGISSAWSQMVSDSKLRKKQYTVVKGKMPTKYNEVALIVNENNEISDYTLYTLGLMDYDQMLTIIDNAKDKKKIDDKQVSIDYDKALNLSFNVFSPSQLYLKNNDAYVDKSDDNNYIKEHFNDATKVTITAILRSNSSSSIKSGIGYDKSLTTHLLNITKESDIVKAQLNNKEINILTGKKFGETTKKSSNPFFSINAGNSVSALPKLTPYLNENEITNKYKVTFVNGDDTLVSSEVNENDVVTTFPTSSPEKNLNDGKIYTFIGWMNGDGKFYTTNQIRNEKVTKETVYKAVFVESTSDAKIEDYLPEGISREMLDNAINEYVKSQVNSNPAANIDNDAMAQYVNNYLKTDLGQKFIRDYMQSYATSYMKDYASQMQNQMKSQMQSYMQKYMQSYMKQYMEKMRSSMNLDLSNDQIKVLMAQMSDSTPTSYEEVLDKIGYSELSKPSKISIYPIDFEGKEKVESFIKTYNKLSKDDSEKVTYTDIIGTVTSSITSIVDTISLVLIAFVAISLIVSSIMIAIITYISVLERTKEIGILRAMGASKNDISKIFNAETFIEGLLSGAFGVIITILLTIPINAAVESVLDVKNIAVLPIRYAIILILISVILTLIAGFLPSRIASKKDPVTSLRSE